MAKNISLIYWKGIAHVVYYSILRTMTKAGIIHAGLRAEGRRA